MRKLLRTAYLVCCVGCTILLVFFLSTAAQPEPSIPQRPQEETRLEQRLAELPVVDFTDVDRNETSDPTRAAKNRRHNSSFSQEGVRRPKLNENMEPVLVDLPLTHQPAEPAIPVASDVIVIGTVRDAKAYLSSDRTDVYSEVTISVEEILKTDPEYGLKINGALTAERIGGAVRFPSGKILRRARLGRNLPSNAHRYLLFLNQTGDGGFSIVTGYELTQNGIVPLDGGADGKGFDEFKNYERFRNASEAALLEAVRKAISERTVGVGGV